jgi:Ca2+-binding RTX toxin-like protein
VEAGRRDDHVEVVNLSVPVILRGGSGDDELIGSDGNDILEGDAGIDDLVGRGGSDTYLFRGPRYQDLNRDDINDESGADDVLDFSALQYAVNVDLASTSNQQIEFETVPVASKFTLNGKVYQFTVFVLPVGESRLNLDLQSNNGTTGIENVRGTRFNDRIRGNELDNELFGNAGADLLYGFDGIDSLVGGLGDDTLYGGDKRDYLYGKLGFDQLFGEGGDDSLDGGYDGIADVLNGGDGADEFVQYYQRGLMSGTFPSPIVSPTDQLVEAENLADFNASLGDKKVKRIVYWTI